MGWPSSPDGPVLLTFPYVYLFAGNFKEQFHNKWLKIHTPFPVFFFFASFGWKSQFFHQICYPAASFLQSDIRQCQIANNCWIVKDIKVWPNITIWGGRALDLDICWGLSTQVVETTPYRINDNLFSVFIRRDAPIPMPGIGIGWIGAKKVSVSVVEHEYWYR